ncbi:MAG TPA: hypothetical protein VH185_01670 [Mycobacterium sp.]|nr:hypothetical protein [Mycobacterium sp.]
MNELATNKRAVVVVYGVLAACAAVLYVAHAKPWSWGVAAAMFVLIPLAWFAYLWSRSAE